MSLTPGSRLGPYEVVAPIGAGGMGEVFRARDTRLDRSVAIKILPAEFAQNAQLKLRFEREARTISQLSHPNICTLYDVGDGYLVMELLEGQTLAERIAKGPLPLDQVIRIGVEIANALDRAHKAGVVHRDLKPSNVMLTKSGAKLLDFGLARPESPLQSSRSTVEETVARPITQEGTLVGTFQYMAPEQLEGGMVDARTDLFAFGALLYEMVTGTRAFEGKSKASVIAAILGAEPKAITAWQPTSPPALDRLIRTCLAKDPDERWQNAHDVAIELASIHAESRAARPAKSRTIAPWAVALAALAAAITASVLYVRGSNAALNQPLVRSSILPPAGVAFDFILEKGAPEVAPNGKMIAFIGTTDAGTNVYVRALDSTAPRQLTATNVASQVFWSPDSRYIGFYADGAVRKIETAGGAPVQICESDVPVRGASWSRDGVILFGRPGGRGIARVSASGGKAVDATVLDSSKRETTHRWPHFLPDGRHFLFLAGPHSTNDTLDTICVGSIDDPHWRRDLIQASSNAVFVDGWIVFSRDRMLTAQRFDLRTLAVIGEPVTLNESPVEYDVMTARAFFSIANDTLVFQPGEGTQQAVLSWFDRTGKRLGTIGEPRRYGSVALSHDGNSVAYSVFPRQNIWTYDLARNAQSRLTYSNAAEYSPVWSPDDTRIAFAANRGGKGFDIYVVDVRTGAEAPLIVDGNDKAPTSWSPDGRYLFYTAFIAGTANDVMVYDLVEKRSMPFTATQYSELSPRISPDGKWVAYQSSAGQPWSVFVAPFPPTGARWQVSPKSGIQPRWRGDGKELFFYGNSQLNAVSLSLTMPPKISTITALPIHGFSSTTQSWDVSADGQKFLIITQPSDVKPPAPLTLVQHFGRELRMAEERRE